MAIKLPFTRQVGLRAYGYMYTMLGTKDSNSQTNVRREGNSLEQPESRQKQRSWTLQRQALPLCAKFAANICLKLFRVSCLQHLRIPATSALFHLK